LCRAPRASKQSFSKGQYLKTGVSPEYGFKKGYPDVPLDQVAGEDLEVAVHHGAQAADHDRDHGVARVGVRPAEGVGVAHADLVRHEREPVLRAGLVLVVERHRLRVRRRVGPVGRRIDEPRRGVLARVPEPLDDGRLLREAAGEVVHVPAKKV
jgi:hypothetical protein